MAFIFVASHPCVLISIFEGCLFDDHSQENERFLYYFKLERSSKGVQLEKNPIVRGNGFALILSRAKRDRNSNVPYFCTHCTVIFTKIRKLLIWLLAVFSRIICYTSGIFDYATSLLVWLHSEARWI